MTHVEKIISALVEEGKEKTAAQLAAQLGTSTNAVRARISNVRDKGFAIYANSRTDTKGRTKTFYRHGTPTNAMVRLARLAQKAGFEA